MIDADLRDVVFTWVPVGPPGVAVFGVPEDYPEPPFRFKVTRQNGSRLRLRMLAPDGGWQRWPSGALEGYFVERTAYTGDVRFGRAGWSREGRKARQDGPPRSGSLDSP